MSTDAEDTDTVPPETGHRKRSNLAVDLLTWAAYAVLVAWIIAIVTGGAMSLQSATAR